MRFGGYQGGVSSVSDTRVPHVVPTPRQAAFTTIKVLRFAGKTSWDQYRQEFEAIVCSNGWDDNTAVLQLLAHLEEML